MSAPVYEIISPDEFLSEGLFREAAFLEQANQYDWSRFTGKRVLVRGCSTVAPPWIYMLITARLQPFANSIRYGNEHDNVVVFRSRSGSAKTPETEE